MTGGSPGTLTAPRPITPSMLRDWPLPDPAGGKYDRGRVVVVGGARKTPGAAILGGVAALRMGAGRLSLAVAESVAAHVAVAVPESGVYGMAEDESGSVVGDGAGDLLSKELGRANGLLLGPGLDNADGTIRLLEEVVEHVSDDLVIVLDAFGVTVLPDLGSHVRERLAGRIVLTPNANELRRLVGADDLGDAEIPGALHEASTRYRASVSCSGWVVSADTAWQVSTGDTGLGTSGSGDVLAGAIAGLVTRGAGRDQATVWATYAHAAAGDGLATKFGRIGFLAGELLPQLPLVLRSLRGD